MMRIVTPLFPLLLLFLSVPPAAAVEIRDLYAAEVAIADRSGEVRRNAVAEALNRVLVKNSGDADGVARNPLDAATAERYVQQFQYREQAPAEPGGAPRLALWVRFDADGVKRLLRERGLPVWGSARPLTLVWLAVEDSGRRELVGANDGSLAHDALKEAGERRGLPVRLPLLDLTDRARVRAADIWGDFHQPIVEVSERYSPQAVLVGRLFPLRGSRWMSRWSLYQGNRQFRWEGEGESRSELVALGVEGAAERLSRAFASSAGVAAAAGDAVELIVSGVGDLGGYRRVMDYLGSLDTIDSVVVAGVKADRVHLQVQTNGAPERLVNTLGLGDTLVPDSVSSFDAPQSGQTNQPEQGYRRALLYRLVP